MVSTIELFLISNQKFSYKPHEQKNAPLGRLHLKTKPYGNFYTLERGGYIWKIPYVSFFLFEWNLPLQTSLYLMFLLTDPKSWIISLCGRWLYCPGQKTLKEVCDSFPFLILSGWTFYYFYLPFVLIFHSKYFTMTGVDLYLSNPFSISKMISSL